jgi:TRAP-type mannitol/chloroaromatic compound transport system permease large subunit
VAPPEVTTPQIYRGVLPFVGLQMIGLAIVASNPELVTEVITLFRSFW